MKIVGEFDLVTNYIELLLTTYNYCNKNYDISRGRQLFILVQVRIYSLLLVQKMINANEQMKKAEKLFITKWLLN
jgi:hypothetical protein